MGKITFENGVTIEYQGTATPADIDEMGKHALSLKPMSPPEDKTRGMLDAFLKGGRNIKDSIVQAGNDVADINANPSLSTGGKILGTFGKFLKPFAQIGAEAVATPLRIGGEVVENFTGKDINEGTANAIKALIEKGMNTEQAQKLMKSYEDLKVSNPEAANALQATFDIADFATLGAGGAKAGTAGFRAAAPVVVKGAEKVSETAASFAGKVGRTTGISNVPLTEAVSNIKERLLSQIEGKSSSLKKLDKTRSDVLDTIATNKKYHPDIDPENKTFNVGKAVQNMDADISSYSEELGGLFKTVDAMDGGVPANTVVGDIMSKLLTPKNAPKFIVGGKSFLNDIQGLVDRMSSIYGDRIPREAIWEIRKQIDQSVEQLSDTNVKKSLRTDVRKAFANSLENSIQGGESDLVKRGMAEIGKVIEARDYTRDVLQGFKIQGGRLTDLIRNQTATQTGAIAGGFAGNILGGPVGALGGYVASKKLGEWLAKNALTNAADRKALINLVKERPAVFDEIKQYIDGLAGKEKSQAKEGMKVLEQTMLESPKIRGGNIFTKKPMSALPEGTPGTIPGATIRLGKKTESSSFRDRINAIKERNKPKPNVTTPKESNFAKAAREKREKTKLLNDNPKAKEFVNLWTGSDDRVAGIVGIDNGQKGNITYEAIKKYLTPEVKKQLKNFSIDKPEKVYRVQRKKFDLQPLTAWTRNLEWAKEQAKKHPEFVILETTANKKNTLVDIDKILPSGIGEIVLKKDGIIIKKNTK